MNFARISIAAVIAVTAFNFTGSAPITNTVADPVKIISITGAGGSLAVSL